MPRYDEMDEILSRVQKNLATERGNAAPTPHRDEPEARRRPVIGIANPGYELSVELVTRILRDSERAHEMLAELPDESLTGREHHTLTSFIDRAREELSRCEIILKRQAPQS